MSVDMLVSFVVRRSWSPCHCTSRVCWCCASWWCDRAAAGPCRHWADWQSTAALSHIECLKLLITDATRCCTAAGRWLRHLTTWRRWPHTARTLHTQTHRQQQQQQQQQQQHIILQCKMLAVTQHLSTASNEHVLNQLLSICAKNKLEMQTSQKLVGTS